MTEDEHIRETYAHFGLCVYLGQVLEHGIVNAMVILRLPNRANFSQSDIDAFMDLQFENTLGKLIRNLRSEVNLSSKLEVLLGEALKTRNWLCHHYFRERAVEFMTCEGRERMIKELQEAQELLRKADDALETAVQPLADRFGWTKEAFEQEYQELLKEHGIVV